jgi:predicted MPP superfamily phosphohydrolase
MEGPDVAKAFAAVPANTCRILLQHQPKRAVANDAWDVRLQLSGHTHGGAILGFDLLVKRMNEGLVRGLYRMGRLALYVNSGTGQWAGFPLRLGVPAEIAVLRLRPE